jgi:hypothetical protein
MAGIDPALIQQLRHADCCITIKKIVENEEVDDEDEAVHLSPGPRWKGFKIPKLPNGASEEQKQSREEFVRDVDSMNAADFNSKYAAGLPLCAVILFG